MDGVLKRGMLGVKRYMAEEPGAIVMFRGILGVVFGSVALIQALDTPSVHPIFAFY